MSPDESVFIGEQIGIYASLYVEPVRRDNLFAVSAKFHTMIEFVIEFSKERFRNTVLECWQQLPSGSPVCRLMSIFRWHRWIWAMG